VNIRTRDGQIGFVHMNHRTLSECALGGFRAHGRGVVLGDVGQHDPDKEMVPYDYMPASGLAELVPGLETAREGDLLRDYDPGTEFVLAFAWQEGRRANLDSYRVRRA